jgi:ABC-type tungstate transport system permease subunit
VSGLSTFEDDNVVVVITPRHVRVGEEQLLALDLVAGSVEGDKQLFNQYGVMLVNPTKHPHVKKDLGQAFIDYLVSDQGGKAIGGSLHRRA